MSGNETNEGYALVTPAKNEEANLLKVAEAVVNQTVTPRLWVIVDDGSTDRTQQIIRDLQGNQSWIVASSLPEHRRDINVHYAEVCKHGFDVAIRYLEEHDISYEFLGLIDADTVVESRYFEKLIGEFRRDRGLGVASGGLFLQRNGIIELENGDGSSPRGSGRLWRKQCFFETGGYEPCEAPPDTISNVRAKLLGFGARQFPSIEALHLRPTASEEGFWAGYEKKGAAWHYLNAHPALVLLNAIFFAAQPPRYRGVAFFLGYFAAFVRREKKIGDEEISRYFWERRPIEAITEALGERRF